MLMVERGMPINPEELLQELLHEPEFAAAWAEKEKAQQMPSSVGDRLRLALEGADMSIRKFHKEIGDPKKGVPGSSYPVIHRYLKGKASPPLAFVQGAAEILNIRPEWLAFGSGSLRPDHEEDGDDRVVVLREALDLAEHLRDLLREAI